MGDLPAENLPTPAAAEDDYASLANQIVDIFYKIYGSHPGFRVNHAKGIVAEGSFVATPAAAALSRAALFDGSSIPFTLRFSNDGGFPAIPDGAPGNIKGMAVKFHMPGRAEVDIVMLAVKTFPMATGEGFRDLLLVISESPDGAPKPTRLDEFAASHPTVLASFNTAGTPDSFAHEEYRGLNAFIFVDKAGRRQAVRYIMTPEELVYLTADEAARHSADFLIDDLPQRIAKKRVVFHFKAQLAEAGDQTKDPSQPWPNDRQVVELGVLTLHKALANSREVQKDLLFLPTNLPDGIELSDDRMPVIRSAVYGVAFARRSR
ncbi:catalase family peroxidase [Paraburkholderia hospita]|uniref:catalase family peroxidase n=1 Tax=Paraburkholderia hospita TaxID=169430 RepID=UPI000B3415F8|nr:catalase family peroxidase [Paraburkholderia hospita]OUL88027.1 catalase [Paraburkholderia hospita]